MEIDRLILGSNPFTGVNHFSGALGRTAAARLTDSRIVDTIEAAIGSGAAGINLSPNARLYDIFSLMKKRGYSKSFGIYLMLPDIEHLRSVLLTGGATAVAKELFSGLGWTDRLAIGARGVASMLSSDYSGLISAYLRVEMKRLQRVLPREWEIRSILVHEQVSDLALALKADGLVKEFAGLAATLQVVPGFVTRNFPAFVSFLHDCNISLKEVIIMTPLNELGFQMVPDRFSCEKTLASLSGSKVTAISILAGGQITLEDAIKYLRSLRNVSSIAVGSSSPNHAKETFAKLSSVFDTSSSQEKGHD